MTQFTKEEKLRVLNSHSKNTLMETLSIEYVDIGNDFVIAKMPVTPKVHQPQGILHGGALVALAESVGGVASHLFIDNKNQEVRGIEITANHLKSTKNGFIFATAHIIHKGKTLHLWEIKITNEFHELISICKLTNMILNKR